MRMPPEGRRRIRDLGGELLVGARTFSRATLRKCLRTSICLL